jgi:hypothetical protein
VLSIATIAQDCRRFLAQPARSRFGLEKNRKSGKNAVANGIMSIRARKMIDGKKID